MFFYKKLGGAKTGPTCWACPFFLHFSVGRTNDLGIHPLMCLTRPTPFFAVFVGIDINIILFILDLKGTTCPARTFMQDRLRF